MLLPDKDAKIAPKRIIFITIITALYWLWETKAEGNIRVDLLLLYPFLFISYIIALWPKFRALSIVIAAILMVINIYFSIISYDLFDKLRG